VVVYIIVLVMHGHTNIEPLCLFSTYAANTETADCRFIVRVDIQGYSK